MRSGRIYIVFLLCLSSLGRSSAQTSLSADSSIILRLDSLVRGNMEDMNVPGASYALVQNGQVRRVGHFGQADRETAHLVDSSSLFMFGSIAKLITTVAVLRLYEQGKVSLDEDIRTYLSDFPIDKKVTLSHLLTHTGGFEETVFERVKLEEKGLLPFKTYMYERVPDLIFEPGTTPAYSNYGMALAGLIVQEISNLSFEEYVRQNIFDPLQMHSSFFAINDDVRSRLSDSYDKEGRKYPIEYVQTVPASMLISTVGDMGKFISFQISGNEDVLATEILRMMQKNQYQSHPALWGRSFGFFEKQYRERTILEHGGARNGFFSHLIVSPKDSLGWVVVANGGDPGFRDKVTSELLKDIYPQQVMKKQFSATTINPSEYTGTYYSNRRMKSGFGKLFMQAGFVHKIKVEEKGSSIHLLGYDYVQQGEDQFDISNDSLRTFSVWFSRDERGKVTQLFLPGRSDSYSRLAWYENEMLALITLLICLVVFSFTLIRNMRYFPGGSKATYTANSTVSIRTYSCLYSAINITFLLSLAVVAMVNGESFQYKLPGYLYVIFTLALLGLSFLPVLFFLVFKNEIRWFNVFYLVVSMIFFLQLYNWNLLGFNF